MAWGNPGYPQAGGVTIVPLPSGALELFGPDGASLGRLTLGGAATPNLLAMGVRFWYRQAVLATNPVGYWRLGEASGTVAVDQMGANNGTYVGAPTLGVAGLLTGDADTAVLLDGSTQYISTPGPVIVGGDWTLLAWVRMTDLTLISGLFGAESGGVYLEIAATTGTFAVSASNVSTATRSIGGLAAGVTAFMGATYVASSGLLTYYLAGVEDSHLIFTPTWTAGAKQISIGDYGNAGIYRLNGTPDEPAIWNRALTAAEIAALYRIGMGQ
jgi:hypothetical protein